MAKKGASILPVPGADDPTPGKFALTARLDARKSFSGSDSSGPMLLLRATGSMAAGGGSLQGEFSGWLSLKS